jgi:hypothetical protein
MGGHKQHVHIHKIVHMRMRSYESKMKSGIAGDYKHTHSTNLWTCAYDQTPVSCGGQGLIFRTRVIARTCTQIQRKLFAWTCEGVEACFCLASYSSTSGKKKPTGDRLRWNCGIYLPTCTCDFKCVHSGRIFGRNSAACTATNVRF